MYRLGKRSYFVTENWFAFFGDGNFEGNLSILSAAYRYAGKNISLDLGLVQTTWRRFRPCWFTMVGRDHPFWEADQELRLTFTRSRLERWVISIIVKV